MSADRPLNLVLVDVLEDLRGVDENSDRSSDGNSEEDVQLQPIDDHRDVAPVFKDLEDRKTIYITPFHRPLEEHSMAVTWEI